jgi:hypothetical protein
METLEEDTIETPVIDSWRRTYKPTRDQIAYATDLCRSELPYAERVRTIRTFDVMDSGDMSELIDRLAEVRRDRMARLRRAKRRRRGVASRR